ncbi:MAG: hypothetical protein C0601_08405 [Candidatus Muiribacterium halophilum]|uniref:Uncharacterized protein n=1 Tax=Muiribacterium halophilum TaxID=2053465 RepID=A0A2N5ZEI8_MUIH1|nr:MAG: hypothetical protein C0601_08405 [Candidatus Muirbacterium halophilum]
MKRIIFFLIVVSILNLTVFGYKLNGSVYDEQLMPVEEAEIYINGVGPYLSSPEGSFTVDTEGNIELIVSKPGLRSYIRSFVITEDSTISVMMKKMINKEEIEVSKGDSLLLMPGSYGISGGFEMIYPFSKSVDNYDISFSFLKLDYKDLLNRSRSRNISSIRGSYSLTDDIELGLSFFITEDDNYSVLNEENIFSVKKRIENPWFPIAVSGVIRENQNMFVFSGAYEIQSDLTGFMQFIYNESLSKEKIDLAFEYKLLEDTSVSIELLQDYSNDWKNYLIKFNRKIAEYDVFLLLGKNRQADYTYVSAGFNSSF